MAKAWAEKADERNKLKKKTKKRKQEKVDGSEPEAKKEKADE